MSNESPHESGGATTLVAPQRPRVDRLPPWKVLLHNDDVNVDVDVVRAIKRLTPLNTVEAMDRMLEAHRTGVALILTTHREHAELLVEQFTSERLTVTMEPDR